MAAVFDGRSARKRLEAEARELGGAVVPAIYQFTLAAGTTPKKALVLDAVDGPLVVCAMGLSTTLAAGGARLVRLSANGTDYTQEPTHSDVLFSGANVEGWPRPIVVGAGGSLSLACEDELTTPSDVVVTVTGFHTTAVVGAALRRNGELWTASQVISATAAAPNPKPSTYIRHDIIALYLVHKASQTDVDGYSVNIGGRNLTPSPLRAVPPTTNELRDPRAWINLPVRNGAKWSSSLSKAGTLTMTSTLVGAARYVG
jgi:hypothetical protein